MRVLFLVSRSALAARGRSFRFGAFLSLLCLVLFPSGASAIEFSVQQAEGQAPAQGAVSQKFQQLTVAVHNQVAAATTQFQFHNFAISLSLSLLRTRIHIHSPYG